MPGTWRKLATPITIPANGVPSIEGNWFRVRVGGVVVAEQEMAVVDDQYVPANHQVTIKEAYFFQGRSMALTATCASVEYPASGDQVQIFWDDGSDNSFATRAAVTTWADGDTSLADAITAKRMLVKAWLERSPNAVDPSWIIGKTLQLDLSLDLNQLSIGVL